ncbi:TPA: restriction endonuclease subunit S [Escherichia coli]|nr:restriction endonuclease subunit S [Escherichia coli]
MPKYDDYVDSGVEWLGRVPSHWQIIRLKNTINGCVNGLWGADPNGKDELVVVRVSDFDEQKLNVSDEKLTYRSIPENERKSRLLKFGDLLIEKSGGGDKTLVGRVVLFDKSYTAVTSNFVAKMTPKNWVNHSFLKYVFFSLYSRGVNYVSIKQTTGIQNLDANSYLNEVFCFPDEFVQAEVANFLDKKTAQIDEAISIKEQQISLLKERKQIIIQQAVTQGLDPNVPMKDSGVDWIGDIPAHWGCTAVKRLLDIPITDGPHTTPQLHDEGIPFISAEAIKGGEINFDKKRGYINEKDYLLFSNKYTPKVNDIYMVKSGATTGRVAIVRTEMKFTIWSPLAVFRVDKNKLNPLYLYYFLQSYSFLKGVELSWSFGTQQNIGMGVLGNLFALAPPLEEQQLIVNSIEPHFREIDIASEQVYQQIEKLKEYKTTLINSAVTGKIKITPEMLEQ